ncbi:hypothetical protein BVL54_21620 [Bacillus paralicheniformis]|nr:hypothetical protein BVL54_21620 [Bacillus paralicheniformis]
MYPQSAKRSYRELFYHKKEVGMSPFAKDQSTNEVFLEIRITNKSKSFGFCQRFHHLEWKSLLRNGIISLGIEIYIESKYGV